MAPTATTRDTTSPAARATRRTLHRWMRDRPALGRQPAELLQQVTTVLLHHQPKLGGAGDAAGRRERLGDLRGGEVLQRMLVDPFRIGLTARTSIMLPRSTACRHGEGRTWTKNASTSSTLPSRTMRLPGLMSRWARPASHSFRIEQQPLVDDLVGDLGLADLRRPVEELHDDQVLALGGDLDDAVRRGHRQFHVLHQAQGVVLVLARTGGRSGTRPRPPAPRTGSSGRACTSGRPARGSWRTAWRRHRCRDRPAIRSRSGVDPPDASSPIGLTSRTVSPSWSAIACRIASPRAPVTSRWAVLPRR